MSFGLVSLAGVARRGARALVCFALVAASGCSSKVGDPPNAAGGTPGAILNMTSGGAGGHGSTVAGTAGMSGTPSCPSPQLACGTSCVDPRSDQKHCGNCTTACTAGTTCQSGQCLLQCASGQQACNGACATVVSDSANCGACGTACSAGQFCVSGACSATCPFQSCTSTSGAAECADVTTNPKHCGACGAACAAGQSCVGGHCVVACPTGTSACGTECVDLATNQANCGACGVACSAGTPCIGGHCGCATGQNLCGGACVDTTSDAKNCGACGTACPAGQACEAGACRSGCSSSALTLCDGSCVDTNTAAAHCGSCSTACAASQTCSGGKCACPGGGTLCGSACLDTTTDPAHCGACATACGSTQTCAAGKCSCSGGLSACGDACVDTQKSDDHCGDCGTVCSGGRSCTAGACACAAGQAFCSGSCVDTQTNAAHCGGCGMGCATGQTCADGKCSGAGGVGADGCTGGLARGVAVSRIDAFQTIQIGIMQDGSEIAASARNTDVVEGRETVFRVFVTPGSGFTSRQLSARVTIVNGATSDQYFAKKTVSTASVVTDQTSTFQVTVPPEKISADSHYYVELVECSMSATGDATSPRFPATGDVSLGARKTGPLKIKVIPLVVNGHTPAVDAASLVPFHDIMVAMYPVTSVEITAGDSVSLGNTLDWNSALNTVQSKRASDKPAADVYYFGLVAPNDTFQQYCGQGCTAGVGFVVQQTNDSAHRAALGIGFPVDESYLTMAHEIGHNHGRNHAPCVPQGGSISGVDPNFPYSGALLTLWGYDSRAKALIDPTGLPNKNDDVTDIMGYCNHQWMSDYTYDGIVNRVASLNGAAKVAVNPDTLSLWRTLLLDSNGPRWGIPVDELAPPSGTAEVAEILDANDNVIDHVVVYRTEVSDIGAASVMVPEPKPDWYAVRVSGVVAHPFGAPVTVKKP